MFHKTSFHHICFSDLHFVTTSIGGLGLEESNFGFPDRFARIDVELRAVLGAGDHIATEFATGKRAACVRTNIIERVKFSKTSRRL